MISWKGLWAQCRFCQIHLLNTIISSKIQHESYDFLGRLEELAQQEERREKALVVGTAAALAVGLLAYIVK